MNDIRVVEATDDMDDGVNFSDMRKELVAQALASRRAFDKSRYINKFDICGRGFFRRIHFGQNVEPLVGNADDAYIRFDRAESIVCRFGGAGVRYCVKKSAFSDVRKTDDTKFHIIPLSYSTSYGSLYNKYNPKSR